MQLGRHLAFEENAHPPMANLLLTLAQRVGCETGHFADATGSFDGLVG
jgi:hypothetical protein